jgi:hypothetical protein
MPLKSKEWFYKQCLHEVKNYTPFAYLAWNLIDKGVGQHDATRGHVYQPIGALQGFFRQFPQHRATVQLADRTRPFNLRANTQILSAWVQWFAARHGAYDRPTYGYDYDHLRTYLRPWLGGNPLQPGRRDGGRGEDEFKKVFRLLPEFWGRR